MGKRTRRRRGHPKGKAYGFTGLRPAAKTESKSASASGASEASTSTQSAPSTSS